MWQEERPLDRTWLLLPTCIDPTHLILVKLLPLHQIGATIPRRVVRDETGREESNWIGC